ncbi:MAG: hypothetical protein U0T84_04330 [Chitinophagales bacterium]
MKCNFQSMLFGATALAVLALTSCRKETSSLTNEEAKSGQDHAVADNTFTETQHIADDAASSGTVSYKTGDAEGYLSGCATVTHDTTATPHQLTIDFGTGCTGPDGRVRTGKIIVSYTGRYKAPGSVKTFHFQGYSVNGNQVSDNSIRVVTNLGYNTANHLTWDVQDSGSVILASNGGTILWDSHRQREMLSGESTPTIYDDKYSVTGEAHGTTTTGAAFTATISAGNPLIRDLSCSYGKRKFTQGQITIDVTGKSPRLLDFGSGACDNIITVTVNGHTKTIYL